MAGKDRDRKHLQPVSSHSRQNVKPRQPRRRPPVGSRSVPHMDEMTESMEDKISLTEGSDIDPAYAQTGADMTETSTYWDDTTFANPSKTVSTTDFLRSSTAASQEGNHPSVAAYYPPGSSYGSDPPDSSPDNSQLTSPYSMHVTTDIGTAWSGSYPTYPSSSDGYAMTKSTSGDMVSYIQPQQYDRGYTRYDASITSSPPRMEVMDDDNNTQVLDNMSSQDQGSHTQALPDPYYSSPSRRWSTDNYQGSIVDSIQGDTDSLSEEQNPSIDGRPRGYNASDDKREYDWREQEYMRHVEPWSSQNRLNEGHDTDKSYIYDRSAIYGDENGNN